MGPLCPCPNSKKPMKKSFCVIYHVSIEIIGFSPKYSIEDFSIMSQNMMYATIRGGLTTHGAPGQ
ncbi:unnamed protein product [Staurois parvus]|uniref:Uncharacterized protein n=1 Tax=Staurois parvus TaxID=386267 RepID=A0ABN9BDF9_9NEOB|nr:unnamed protein product [Staurois parvus]